jgi:23S rRNA (cytosine1962-C5)-methyltransferase
MGKTFIVNLAFHGKWCRFTAQLKRAVMIDHEIPRITLKSKKDEAVRRYHPWVFSGAVKSIDGTPHDGDWVDVYSNKGGYLASGHYQVNGSIAVRLLSWKQERPNPSFYADRISAALQLRHVAGLKPTPSTNAFRLIYAEGDHLPGLIADYYNGHVVLQCHSSGMLNDIESIAEALKEVLGESIRSLYLKPLKGSDVAGSDSPFLIGEDPGTTISEHNIMYQVNWVQGQKTGFFLDQRENRKLVKSLSNGKKVLNTFCYTGGFSLAALHGGAQLVHSVDSSAGAIDMLRNNFTLNDFSNEQHPAFVCDALQFLQENELNYDLIILDPPAYAKHLSARHNAVQGYKRLNATALKAMKPGALLMTFSCSQVVERKLFEATIMAAALAANRQVSILSRLSQPADHPVSLFHPEGEYLKGLLLAVK